MSRKHKPSHPLIDTNVFIERKLSDSVLDRMYLSSVVLYELIAANIDDSTFKLYSAWRKTYSATNQLLSPTTTDWYECSKLIRNMLRGQRSQTMGQMPKITSAQQ